MAPRVLEVKPEAFETQPYAPNPYDIKGFGDPMMPWSYNDELKGFKVRYTVGPCFGAFDSPVRSSEQPFTATMSQIAKKGAMASLQAEARALGGGGLIGVQFHLQETVTVTGGKASFCEATGTAVKIRRV